MLSFIFGSLSRQVDQWVAEWEVQSNGNAKKLGWPSRVRFHFAERPFEHLFVLWLLVVCVSLICERFTAWTGIPKVFTDYGNGEFVTFFTGLLSLQATLAALVYPLVIAFVAVFLQRRASAKLSLRLYALDAAIAPAGISALALVAWMTLQCLALPYAPLDWVAAAMLGNILWAFYNVLLTGWFLYRTVLFFDDEVRYRAFVRYAMHTAFPREARVHLLGLILSHAQDGGQLPKGSEERQAGGPMVHIFPMSEGEDAVVIRNPGGKAVVDVRMRLLRWAIRLWLGGLRNTSSAGEAQRYSERPVLTIPIVPGKEASERLVVCRVKNANKPGWFASLLMRHSVVLGRPILSNASVATSDVLEELSVEALTLLEEKRFEAARETIQAMVDVHVALIKAGEFTDSEGDVDHVGLLRSPYGLGGELIHHTWLDPYRTLALASINMLETQIDVFSRHSHLMQRLAIRLSSAHPKVLVGLVRVSSYLSYRLSGWWSAQVDERNIRHSISVAAVLPNPANTLYSRAMKSFIEGWESAQLYPRENSIPTVTGKWLECRRVAAFEGAKLSQLVKLILEAAVRGDRTAVDWLLDSFFYWRSGSHLMSPFISYDERRYRRLDFSCFDRSWEFIRSEVQMRPGDNEFEIAKQVLRTVLRARWEDLRLLLVVILLDWTEDGQPENAFSLDLVTSILGGRSPNGRSVESERDPEMVLVRLFNMRDDFLVREASELQRPDMVSGRIYSRSGSDDLDSLAQFQFWMLVILASCRMVRTPHLDTLLAQCGNDIRQLSHYERSARALAAYGDNLRIGHGLAVVAEVRRQIQAEGTTEDAHGWVVELLQRFADSASSRYESVVANSSISLHRLGLIRQEVTRYILSREYEAFPFSVCRSVLSGTEHVDEARVNFEGINKVSLAEPELQEWTDEDARCYSEEVAHSIATRLILEHLRREEITALVSDDEATFASALTLAAAAIVQRGATPIILLENQFPDWVHPNWGEQVEQIDGAVTATPPLAGDAKGVYSYLNGVPAHITRLSGYGCFVVAMEDFELVRYMVAGDDSCVSVTAEEMGNNALRVSFGWRFWTEAVKLNG